MHWEALNENCIFAFSPEIEPLLGVLSLLSGELKNPVCTDLYGAEQIKAWKQRYRFLFETFDAVKNLSSYSIFDMLLDVFDKDFTVEGFQANILSLPEEERIFRQAGWNYLCGATQEDILHAFREDTALDALYARIEAQCSSFLGFSSFIRQNKKYIKEYFALAAELDNPMLRNALQSREKEIETFRAQLIETLKTADGLKCSQNLMGKTFYNRGPYEQFCFLPSLLLPFAAVRFFNDDGTPHNRQILIYSIREPEKGREDTMASLKALSDETRYQILMLLAKQGSVNGQDIARKLKLAPSTVSHHMTELKERGLITEEPVKTAKYYGISKNVLRELLKTVQDDLKLNDLDGTLSKNKNK